MSLRAAVEPLRAALGPFVRAERLDRHDGPLVASVYHLVPRGESAAYLAALEAAAPKSALRVSASGPWPPYAFGPEAACAP